MIHPRTVIEKFCELTGQKLTASYAREQVATEFLRRGLTLDDLALVVRWTRAQIGNLIVTNDAQGVYIGSVGGSNQGMGSHPFYGLGFWGAGITSNGVINQPLSPLNFLWTNPMTTDQLTTVLVGLCQVLAAYGLTGPTAPQEP